MVSSTTKTKETSAIIPPQNFKLNGDSAWGIIHLPDGQRIIACSYDGSLRIWDLKNGKQIGKGWRDGKSAVGSIALSPDEKTVVSGSKDGAVRL